uniref:Uncharacterized protein n=1 Tax=Arundo donax TaxID=35708 RepID=A0A0A9DVK1_ARUDO
MSILFLFELLRFCSFVPQVIYVNAVELFLFQGASVNLFAAHGPKP